MNRSIVSLSLVLGLSLVPAARSATSIWTNGVAGNWNLASGWSNGLPTSADIAVYQGASLTLTSAVAVNTFYMSAANANNSFTIASGGSLTVNGGVGSILVGVGTGGGGFIVTQTNSASAATTVNAATIESRGLTVNSPNNTSTAYLTLTATQSWNPDKGLDSSGTRINIATTTDRNARLTLQGAITSVKGLTLGAASGAGTAELILDGGTLAAGLLQRNSGGNASFEFHSGTLKSTSGRILTNKSLSTTATLDIELGATGTRHIDTTDGNIFFDSTTRLLDLTTPGGSLTKSGLGTLTLAGTNSYTGNTTISAGTLVLADNAQLHFAIFGAGLNNQLNGTGTLQLHGDFSFDLSLAGTNPGDSWTIVDVASLTEIFGPTFSVLGFTDNGDDTWANANYLFNETTGMLAVIPEPSSVMLVGAGLLLLAGLRRRK